MLSLLVCWAAAAVAAPARGRAHTHGSRIRRGIEQRRLLQGAWRGAGVDAQPLRGKTAVVTGGSRGIGAAVAKALATRGANVVVVYASDDAAADATVASLPGEGHTAVRCDVADADAVESLIEGLDGLDIVVNNAGVYEEHPVLDAATTYAAWQRAWATTLDVNLVGPARRPSGIEPRRSWLCGRPSKQRRRHANAAKIIGNGLRLSESSRARRQTSCSARVGGWRRAAAASSSACRRAARSGASRTRPRAFAARDRPLTNRGAAAAATWIFL